MSVKIRNVRVVECDGCGYTLGDRYTTLELAYAESPSVGGTLTFHFHQSSDQHDCLRYWIMNSGILERSLRDAGLLSERGREVILKTLCGAGRRCL